MEPVSTRVDQLYRAFQLFYPLILMPGIVWVIWRYLPLLKEAGRVRVWLLVLFVGGLLSTQIARAHEELYPFAMWTMYSSPSPEPMAWRFWAVDSEGRELGFFKWERVAPIHSRRAFGHNFTLLAQRAAGPRNGDPSDMADDEQGEVLSGDAAESKEQAAERLEDLLSQLIDQHNTRTESRPVAEVRVQRCPIDVQNFVTWDRLACETIMTVRPRIPSNPSQGAGPEQSSPHGEKGVSANGNGDAP